jgi:hypothetical protein
MHLIKRVLQLTDNNINARHRLCRPRSSSTCLDKLQQTSMRQHRAEASHALGYRTTTTAAFIGPLAAQSFSRVTEYPYKAADRLYMSRLLQ